MGDGLVEIVRSLRSVIVDNRDETEANRQLSEPIVNALIEAQLCRMALPADDGGLETSPVDAMAVYEELAVAEASVAWVVWNNSLACWWSRFLTPQVRQEIFGDPRGLYANSTRPSGIAVVEGDSYRVSGRWGVVSGCMHAKWIPVMCVIERDGQIDIARPDVSRVRVMFAPRSSFEIIDTWNVGGLRGAGSHDAVLVGELVPANRSVSFKDQSLMDSPLGRVPVTATMAAGCAFMCLGVARAAIEAVVELGRTKVSPDPSPDLRDSASTQATIARAATTVDAMRERLYTTYTRLWGNVEAHEPVTPEVLGDVWAASVTTALECRDAVSKMYAMAGTSSLYVDSPIERAHRDIHAMLQHVITQPLWLEEAGRVKLGLEPTTPMFFI